MSHCKSSIFTQSLKVAVTGLVICSLACEKCNQKKGNKPIEQFLKNKQGLQQLIKSKASKSLKDAAAVNATRNKLVKALEKAGTVFTATGAQTKFNRCRLKQEKQHWVDAACVGDVTTLVFRINQPLKVTCKGHGGRQKAALNKYGYPLRHNPLKPIKGWCSGDIAKNLLTGSFGRVNPLLYQ